MPIVIQQSVDPQGPLDFHPKVAANGYVMLAGLAVLGAQWAANYWPSNADIKALNVAIVPVAAWLAGYAKQAKPVTELRQRRLAAQQRRDHDRRLEATAARKAKPSA